jgi:DNA polymerase-3 subunit beta
MLKKNIKINHAASSTHKTLPALEQARLYSDHPDRLIVETTNLDVFVATTNELFDVPFLNVCVPAKELNNVISMFDDFEIIDNSSDGYIIFKNGRKKVKLNVFPAQDFPNRPIKEDGSINFNLNKNDILKCFSFSSEVAKGVLNGINISSDGYSVKVASTDGYKLTKVEVNQKTDPFNVILDGKNTIKMLSLLDDGEVNISLSPEVNFVTVKQNDVEIVLRVISGKYPDYERIIPRQFLFEYSIQKNAILSVLKEAKILADKDTHLVDLSFNESELTISAGSGKGIYTDVIQTEKKCSEDMGKISFNLEYLISVISKIDDKNISLKMNADTKPVMFDSGDGSHRSMLMPIMN